MTILSDNNPDSVSKFNQMYSDQSLTKLKIIASYFTEYPMNMLAFYIRVLECMHTLRSITCRQCAGIHSAHCTPGEGMFRDICREILPFCNEKEQNTLNNLLSFYENMENMQEMMQMMEMMQEMGGFGDGSNGSTGGPMDMSQILNMMNAFSS